MKAYIQEIDITNDGRVIVSGHLPQTNLKASLNELHYIEEPQDGIWGYILEVIPISVRGATMLVPFIVEAPWTGNEKSNGVRITQSSLTSDDLETTLLKVKKVKDYSFNQENSLQIQGVSFDKSSDQLIIDVKYGGGCFPHSFSLEWDGTILKSTPPQYNFNLVDTSKYDPCKAFNYTQLRFDINTPSIQISKPSIINLGTAFQGGKIQIHIE